MNKRSLWLIDAGYLFNARHSIRNGYEFSYLKLRNKLEEYANIWRAYYLNSTPMPPTEAQSSFHNWLRSAPPNGPQIITKIYSLKTERADKAYCDICGQKVSLRCPHQEDKWPVHKISNEIQKGVDVGIATLALTLKDMYDTLILSSGDADLIDAVEFLSMQDKRLELFVFKDGVATELQCRADKVHWINDFAEEVASDS